MPLTHFAGLTRVQRWGLVLLVLFFAVFGVFVEHRSVFLRRHMTDFQVYVRAAWAVRAGEDFYQIEDDNHWHYHYPPLFAILLTPLANPPAHAASSMLTVPFAVSVAIWYLASLGCLVFAVHWLARAVEETSPCAALRDQPRGSQRWWALRVWPILACLPTITATLMRGQVNLLLLLLLCGMLAAHLRGRRAQAGLWLAGAICLKLIPAFLIVYPLWRRDVRCLAACAGGLVLGLCVIPAAVLGPQRTLACYEEWTNVLIRPGLGKGEDPARAKELLEATATDSQSFVILFHNFQNPERDTRPLQPAPELRAAHWLLGGALTLVTLLASGWRRATRYGTLLAGGALTLLMLLLSPVCHLHYFCLALPLVMGLLVWRWERQPANTMTPQLGWGVAILLVVNGVANVVPHVPGLELTRDIGLAAGGTLFLWLTGVVVLWRIARTANQSAVRAGVVGHGLSEAA